MNGLPLLALVLVLLPSLAIRPGVAPPREESESDAAAIALDARQSASWVTGTESDEAVQAFETGLDEFMGSNNARALQQLDRALAADPGFGAARAVRAFITGELSVGSEFEQAVADASRGSAPEALLALALRETRAGRTGRGRLLAATLAEMRPSDLRFAVFHATFLPGEEDVEALRALAREHQDEALPHLWLAIRTTPVAFASTTSGQEREAMEAVQTALDLDPGSPAGHVALARLLQRTGNGDEALDHLGLALELGATPAETHEMVAEIQLQEGRVAEARQALQEALDTAMGDGARLTYRRGLAILLLHEGDLEGSTAALRELALEAEQEGRMGSAGTTHRFLAAIHASDGDRERALYHLGEAWRVNPVRGNQSNYATMVYWLLGDGAEARAALEDYIEAAGPAPTASTQDYIHLMTGQALLAEGKPAAALEELARSGDNPYAQLARWEAYEALGRSQEAEVERNGLLERKNFSLYSTGTPIARYRATHR